MHFRPTSTTSKTLAAIPLVVGNLPLFGITSEITIVLASLLIVVLCRIHSLIQASFKGLLFTCIYLHSSDLSLEDRPVQTL